MRCVLLLTSAAVAEPRLFSLIKSDDEKQDEEEDDAGQPDLETGLFSAKNIEMTEFNRRRNKKACTSSLSLSLRQLQLIFAVRRLDAACGWFGLLNFKRAVLGDCCSAQSHQCSLLCPFAAADLPSATRDNNYQRVMYLLESGFAEVRCSPSCNSFHLVVNFSISHSLHCSCASVSPVPTPR